MDKRARKHELWLRPVLTWIALCLLLALTCGLSYVPLGSGNLPVALAIAAIKASLVALVFMRLFEPNPLDAARCRRGPPLDFHHVSVRRSRLYDPLIRHN
ncbi:MAG TPA: cytochrome C oxidase subunit IV family protein [Rhizomicrobium sp.]|nr:cytochrome C oxidase subunit IV family protein [Rhizomicrobium sp.]